MKLDVKARDDQGNLIFEGSLNRNEVAFLIQFAINDLIAAGVEFYAIGQEQEEGDESVRFPLPIGGSVN